jgi:hypothetical protein
MSDLHTFYRDTEPWIAAAAYSKYGHPEEDYVLLEAISPLRRRATSTSRCWWCTVSWTPTSRSARRTRSSPRCGSWAVRWSTWSCRRGPRVPPADSRQTLIERIRDFLVSHV